MGFRLRKREAVADGLRRLSAAQLARAAGALRTPADPEAAIRDARVRIKRVRALLALSRGGMGHSAARESQALGLIGRSLGARRDASALLDAFNSLRVRFGALDPVAFTSIGDELTRWAARVQGDASAGHQTGGQATEGQVGTVTLAVAADGLARAADRARAWTISGAGFEVIRPGLLRSYADVRAGRRDALDAADPLARHAWRIRVKRLAEQLRVLRAVWPEVMEAHASELRSIGRRLGQEHDLWLLGTHLRAAPESFGTRESVMAIARLADRAGLEAAQGLRAASRRGLAEKPGAFVERVGLLWKAWRAD